MEGYLVVLLLQGLPGAGAFSKTLLSRRAGLMGDVLLRIQSSLEVHSRCRHRPRNPYSLASYHRTQVLSWWFHSPDYSETHLGSLCIYTQAVLFVPRFWPICPPAIFGSKIARLHFLCSLGSVGVSYNVPFQTNDPVSGAVCRIGFPLFICHLMIPYDSKKKKQPLIWARFSN